MPPSVDNIEKPQILFSPIPKLSNEEEEALKQESPFTLSIVNPPKDTFVKTAGGETNMFERDNESQIGLTSKLQIPPLNLNAGHQQAQVESQHSHHQVKHS